MDRNKEVVNWGRVFTFAGAFIAFLIGSGFATGQEVLQYFSSYGYMGLAGVIVDKEKVFQRAVIFINTIVVKLWVHFMIIFQ